MNIVQTELPAAVSDLRESPRYSGFYRTIAFASISIAVLLTLAAIMIPAGISWDFANFYDTGRRVAIWSINDIYRPDTLIGGTAPQGNLAFFGTPISALLYAPLAWLDARTGLLVFKFQSAAFTIAGLALLWRSLLERTQVQDQKERWKFAAILSIALLLFQPFWSIYRVGGQTTPIIFFLFSLSLNNFAKGNYWITAVLIVSAVLIKPAFVLVLVPLLLISDRRFAFAIAFISLVATAISVLILGWEVHLEFLRVMNSGMSATYPWLFNSSLYVAADNLKIYAPELVDALWLNAIVTAAKLAVCLAFLKLFLESRKLIWQNGSLRQFDLLMSIAFCMMILQTVWEHYLIVLFPLLVYLTVAYGRSSSSTRYVLIAIFALSATQNVALTTVLDALLAINSPVELLLAGVAKCLPLALLLFLVIRRTDLFTAFGGMRRSTEVGV